MGELSEGDVSLTGRGTRRLGASGPETTVQCKEGSPKVSENPGTKVSYQRNSPPAPRNSLS